MPNSLGVPWSDNPNAPKIPYRLYIAEKENFAGIFISAILYGIIVILFFQCMRTLIDPANRTRGGLSWGFITQTVALFSAATISTAMTLNFQPISYVDAREYPGVVGLTVPGPFGYQYVLNSKAENIVPLVATQLVEWLADGLLLYRCYIIYAMNYWVIALPFMMYLASFAVGIAFIYWHSLPNALVLHADAIFNFGLPFQAICLSLNVLLTLMIVARLVLHGRNIRNAMGPHAKSDRLYNTIVTIIVESFALYAIASILSFVTWVVDDSVQLVFGPILSEVQVIAPFLIIQRVADQRAVTKDTIPPVSIGSIHFGSRGESVVTGGTVTEGGSMPSIGAHEQTSDEPSIEAEDVINEVPL